MDRLFSDSDSDLQPKADSPVPCMPAANDFDLAPGDAGLTTQRASPTLPPPQPDTGSSDEGAYDSDGNAHAADSARSMQISRVSKKEAIERRKMSERLKRVAHVELPARRGTLSIDHFLAKFNIQRPKSELPQQNDSGEENPVVDLELAEAKSTIAPAPIHEAEDAHQKTDPIEAENISTQIVTDAKDLEQQNELKLPLHESNRQQRLLDIQNRLSLHITPYFALQGSEDSDGGIEIVQPSLKTEIERRPRVSIVEKNRSLKALAEMQNRARRELEAKEYAEALEAKKRRREERKTEKKAAREREKGQRDNASEGDDNDLARNSAVTRKTKRISDDEDSDPDQMATLPLDTQPSVDSEVDLNEGGETNEKFEDEKDIYIETGTGGSTAEAVAPSILPAATQSKASLARKKAPVKRGTLHDFFAKQQDSLNKTNDLAVVEVSSLKEIELLPAEESLDELPEPPTDTETEDGLSLLSEDDKITLNKEIDKEIEDGNDGDAETDSNAGTDEGPEILQNSLESLGGVLMDGENDDVQDLRNMNGVLMSAAKALADETPKLPRIKSNYIEEEADEEEDEFFGLGGEDGEGNEDDDAPLVCSGDEDVIEDFSDIIDLHRKQGLEDDTKLVQTMLDDVTNGNLRKKARRNHFGTGFELSDTDDEETLLRNLKRAGARGITRRKANGADGNSVLDKFASDPKTAAFAKCFDTFNTSEEENGLMSSSDSDFGGERTDIRAQLAKDLSLRFGKRRIDSAQDREGSFDGSLDEDAISVRKKRSIIGLSAIIEDDDYDDIKTKKSRKILADDDAEDAKSQVADERVITAYETFEISKLIRRSNMVSFQKIPEGDQVHSMKYTSRMIPVNSGRSSVVGLHAKAALSNAFITSKPAKSRPSKSPATLAKLKSDVIAANGGVPLSRGTAGGLDSVPLPVRRGNSASVGSGAFLVGERAKNWSNGSRRSQSNAISDKNKVDSRDRKKEAQLIGSGSLLGVLQRSSSSFL
ncbi:hypothetical protein HDU83_002551 [Entophlyctis luteolus]|nr:hypothetical protein HDU83_002551 [Entophlyctis luteolus]